MTPKPKPSTLYLRHDIYLYSIRVLQNHILSIIRHEQSTTTSGEQVEWEELDEKVKDRIVEEMVKENGEEPTYKQQENQDEENYET